MQNRPSAFTKLPTNREMTFINNYAEMAVRSKTLPKHITHFKATDEDTGKDVEVEYSFEIQVARAFIIAMRGWELGLSIGFSFDEISIIEGKPAASAKVMLANVEKFYPCAYMRWVNSLTDGKVSGITIWAKKDYRISVEHEPLQEFHFDLSMAEAANLLTKWNWLKYPDKMVKWRVVADMCRTIFPRAVLGFYLADEISRVDIQSTQQEIEDQDPEIPWMNYDILVEKGELLRKQRELIAEKSNSTTKATKATKSTKKKTEFAKKTTKKIKFGKKTSTKKTSAAKKTETAAPKTSQEPPKEEPKKEEPVKEKPKTVDPPKAEKVSPFARRKKTSEKKTAAAPKKSTSIAKGDKTEPIKIEPPKSKKKINPFAKKGRTPSVSLGVATRPKKSVKETQEIAAPEFDPEDEGPELSGRDEIAANNLQKEIEEELHPKKAEAIAKKINSKPPLIAEKLWNKMIEKDPWLSSQTAKSKHKQDYSLEVLSVVMNEIADKTMGLDFNKQVGKVYLEYLKQKKRNESLASLLAEAWEITIQSVKVDENALLIWNDRMQNTIGNLLSIAYDQFSTGFYIGAIMKGAGWSKEYALWGIRFLQTHQLIKHIGSSAQDMRYEVNKKAVGLLIGKKDS